MERKSVLGRGLDAIIPDRISSVEQAEFIYVTISDIVPNAFQPRQQFTPDELNELVQSIKANGILQPIVVRRKGSKFEIIAGGRRFEAVKMLGWDKIPAVIKENISDKESFVLAIVENLQRQNLNPLEEAYSFKRLTDDFSLSLQDIADSLGKDKSTISNAMRLLKLPHEIREALRTGIISKGQARTILSLDVEHEQLALFHRILNEELTVRSVEEEVRKHKGKKRGAHAAARKSVFMQEIEQLFQQKFGTKVYLVDKGNKGKIVIEYYSEEDLERVALRIKSIV